MRFNPHLGGGKYIYNTHYIFLFPMHILILVSLLRSEGTLGVEGSFFTWLCLLFPYFCYHITVHLRVPVSAAVHTGAGGVNSKKSHLRVDFHFLPFHHPNHCYNQIKLITVLFSLTRKPISGKLFFF